MAGAIAGVAVGAGAVIVGTAGHIDHGKTALLKALTGQAGDLRQEERERGMTIDLGYRYAALAEGAALTGFIDVPRAVYPQHAGRGPWHRRGAAGGGGRRWRHAADT